MRRLVVVMLMAVAILVVAASEARAVQGVRSTRISRELGSGWEFRQVGEGAWLPSRVPGCVHTDLLAAGRIPDPFYRDNETKLQWIGKTDWEYRTTFTAGASELAREHVELVFEGLDTYATVFLNGARVLEADNMFRTWRVDAKPHLTPGRNELLVRFRSPINEILPRMKTLGYELPAVNDQGEKTSPHTRKAPYQYGWDWGPRFVTSGVWQPVRLEAWDGARLDGLHVVAQRVTAGRAELDVEVAVVAGAEHETTVVVDSADVGVAPARATARLRPGRNTVRLTLTVSNPRLWWPNGLGAQPLYSLRARALDGRRVFDTASARVGIRTVELRQEPDQWGKSFAFVVNGVPVFAKGGNWIPADSFPNRVTPERYRQLLESCRDANMNMVRVWGGGIYEEDVFYELCDELGLMVWQDFMFACSMYPGDDVFLENVRQEAIDNVRRLRNHPSIVLWCGNNEVETAWMHWGWKDRLPAGLWDDYKKLFHGVLPAVVAEHDPTRSYWPSSPSSNLEDDADSQKIGDVHFWAVWHASEPFDKYKEQHPRFMSEYGFQSFPLIETVKSYTVPTDWNIESPVMKHHQRHPRGNALIREYMLREFREPKDFESFLYVSQVLQAEGIKLGTEHMRRIMPRNMGALYWQVDDCWPVASWSGMDYFGRWKAMHYYARRFFDHVLVSTDDRGEEIAIYVTSDRKEAVRGDLRVRVRDFTGRVLSERVVPVEAAPVSSSTVVRARESELLAGADPRAVYLESELVSGGTTLSRSRHFFVAYKDLLVPRPTLTTRVGRSGRATTVTVMADTYARAVHLTLDGASFSDNFFDLAAGERVTVTVRASRPMASSAVERGLRVRSLADAF